MSDKVAALSKSTFIRGVQCLKSLYLNKNRPFLRDRLSAEQLAKFKRGHEIGHLARDLYPGGINCAPGHPSQYRAALEKTAQSIANGDSVIYEAAFRHEGILVLLDILIKDGATWHALEVKSSLHISETYLTDAALQYYVIKGSGLTPETIRIVHLNPAYRLIGSLDIQQLFVTTDVTEKVLALQEYIGIQIEKSREALTLKKSPDIPVGRHCRHPYPCDFTGHCWKNIKSESVFSLTGLPFDRRCALYENGYTEITGIPEESLPEKEQIILRAHRTQRNYVNSDRLHKRLAFEEQPVFVSFFVFRSALPLFEGHRPFEPVIFASASCEGNQNPQSVTAFPGSNPAPDIRNFLAQILNSGRPVVYFGNEQIRQALDEPEIFCNDDRFLNLAEVFEDRDFYTPGLDPEGGLFETAAALRLSGNSTGYISEIMQGVRYLNITGENREETLKAIREEIQEAAVLTSRIYQFLNELIS